MKHTGPAGSIASMVLAESLLTKFSGKGLEPDEIVGAEFLLAVALGAGLTVIVATSLILASTYGLPVSTTHVSVGSLFGIGLIARKANVEVVLGIVLSWLLTLPCAALVSGIIYRLVGHSGSV